MGNKVEEKGCSISLQTKLLRDRDLNGLDPGSRGASRQIIPSSIQSTAFKLENGLVGKGLVTVNRYPSQRNGDVHTWTFTGYFGSS